MNTIQRMAGGAMVGLGVLAGPVAPGAFGQEMRMVATASPMGGPGDDGAVTKQAVARYTTMLKLDAGQSESLKSIHDGYQSAYKQARDKHRAAMMELIRQAQEDEDQGGLLKQLPEQNSKNREELKKLERAFFGDLKALLGDAQLQLMPKVERTRRREVGMRGGSLSGESVDLVDVLDALKVNPEGTARLPEAVESYEAELDRLLADRAAAFKDAPKLDPSQPESVLGLQGEIDKSREIGAKIRDANEQHARKFEELLPENLREKFALEIRRRSFPKVYRQAHVVKQLEAAAAFGDLDDSQRAELRAIREAYDRDADPINDRWAKAIRESEVKGDGGVMMLADGARLRMSIGDDEDKGVSEARKARRELDDRMQARLKSVLKPEQVDRLPTRKPGPEDAEGEWTGPGIEATSAVIIRTEGAGHGGGR